MESVTSKDGTTISFMKSGEGPPLIIVHGTTADHTRWNPVVSYLEKHFTVYAVDRRGRGESGDSPEYHIMKEAEDIAAVVNAADGPVSILGHSHGAICVLEGSLLTDNIEKIVLYEPPLPLGDQMYPPGVPERMQDLIDSGKPEGALEVFFREIVKMPDKEFEFYSNLPVYKRRISYAHTVPREITLDKYYGFNPDKFKELNIPVLLLLGGDSPEIFRKAVDTLNSVLPDSRIAVFPDQQHVAMDTDPGLFVKEVLDFLID